MVNVEIKHCWINLDDDLRRYKWMVRFHAIDGFLFLIRFVILCTDLSAASSANIDGQSSLGAFLAFVVLLELLGGLSVLLGNVLYSFLKYTSPILFETTDDQIPFCPRRGLLRLSTLTCFTCDCYYDHPHAVLLTRVTILGLFIFLRFIAFILGAVCAGRYPPRAIAYTVFAALSFLPSIVTMILEYRHHRRLWHYYPDGEPSAERSSKHTQFLPYSLMNDARTNVWRSSLCTRPQPCSSRSLYHILLYHSSATTYEKRDRYRIGFHQTAQKGAFGISKSDFNRSDRGMLGPGVYFATCIEHTEFKANYRGAYICARVSVGNEVVTTSRDGFENGQLQCDTVYFKHNLGSDEFCVRDPEQVKQWIIVVNQDDTTEQFDDIKDHFHSETYTGCIY